jgi:hypothetical protein
MKTWYGKLFAFLVFLVVSALLIGTRSKTLDLIWIILLLSMRVLSGSFAVSQLRIHRGPNGEVSFRPRPGFTGLLPTSWRRWLFPQ